jgi:nitrogen fixation protein NifU and related proteins
MSDLRDLYQEVILEHGKNPRNYGFPARSNREGKGFNPLCGDRITLKLWCEDDVIGDIGFEGAGCAISQAAASIMTETVRGKTVGEALALFTKFHDLVTRGEGAFDELDRLAAFAGVSEFPARVKCATLAWHTLEAALQQKAAPATTE